MSSARKRSLSYIERSISPPSVRRKVVSPLKQPADAGPQSTQKSSIRIFSWNIDGIGPLLQKQISFQTSSLYPLRTFLKRHQWPHLLCLQEVKINPQDQVTQRRLIYAANVGCQADEHTYTAHFSLPRDKYNGIGFGGKVYGVATLIRDDISTEVTITRKPDWDLEGRVLVHEFASGLLVVNGYWVNGTSHPYRNSKTGEVEGTRHDHKLRFHQCMLSEAQGLERQGKRVVLVGDMNVAPSAIDAHPDLRAFPVQHVLNRADFNYKFLNQDSSTEDGMRGIDVFRKMYGNSVRKYSWFSRNCGWGQSCDRVDNIIVSQSLFKDGAVSATDICDNPIDRGHSDHVPIWVDIDIKKVTQRLEASKSIAPEPA